MRTTMLAVSPARYGPYVARKVRTVCRPVARITNLTPKLELAGLGEGSGWRGVLMPFENFLPFEGL